MAPWRNFSNGGICNVSRHLPRIPFPQVKRLLKSVKRNCIPSIGKKVVEWGERSVSILSHLGEKKVLPKLPKLLIESKNGNCLVHSQVRSSAIYCTSGVKLQAPDSSGLVFCFITWRIPCPLRGNASNYRGCLMAVECTINVGFHSN